MALRRHSFWASKHPIPVPKRFGLSSPVAAEERCRVLKTRIQPAPATDSLRHPTLSAKQPFFSRRVVLFGNIAVVVMCVLFFIIPFGFRGARIALSEMKNEVADWLPADFAETKELEDFRRHFIGAQFVVMSWDGCAENDPRFSDMVDKLLRDTQGTEFVGIDSVAKDLGDQFGLHVTDIHEGWSSEGEKWMQGDGGQWYYLTRDGGLYRWSGGSNLVGFASRSLERLRTGKVEAKGELVHQFEGADAEAVYANPQKLNSRLFKQILTGPDVLEQLAGPDGSLIRGEYDPRDPQIAQIQIEAHQRLTGVFFGPTPVRGFDWTRDSFLAALPSETTAQLPDAWGEYFDGYVARIVETKYEGDKQKLIHAPDSERLAHWLRLFYELQVPAPPRPTCIVAALSDVASRDLSRVAGRPDFFKPVGRLYMAAQECGISPAELHLGGPPVDNVAIDEEGTITLFKLVSLSTAIGLTLAYISFRSIGVTMMIFFVGGVSAVISVGFVWFGGSTLDAVLLSMPSLVYVLGLSGAVHIVNYYREECHLSGEQGACERGLSHGWFACTLAAFTTALGLLSLVSSNLIPIQKFGFYAASGTMATLVLLFAFLPSALTIWPPGYKKEAPKKNNAASAGVIFRFWDRFGQWIVFRHRWVMTITLMVMVGMAFGMSKIKTSVQLLKLFDDSAKVISDYQWLEANLGRLVPMELVVEIQPESFAEGSVLDDEETPAPSDLQRERRLTFLERMELAGRVRKVVEAEFGESGRDIIGPGMSSDVMILPGNLSLYDSGLDRTRAVFNQNLLENRDRLHRDLDFFRIDSTSEAELWRVSLRLGAFNNVDYGRFVADLQQAVEPVLAAYRTRDRVLRAIYHADAEGNVPTAEQLKDARILIIGWKQEADVVAESSASSDQDEQPLGNLELQQPIDQTGIFCKSLVEVLANRGFSLDTSARGRRAYALDLENPDHVKLLEPGGAIVSQLSRFSCIILARDPGSEARERLIDSGVPVVDALEHTLAVDPTTKEAISPTAAMLRRRIGGSSQTLSSDLPSGAPVEAWNQQEDQELFASAVYTGIVPIVYKAQRTLLSSLADSIQMSFWMIAITMMILLRDWRRGLSPGNVVNFAGGLVSMIPNLFPIVMIFGFMGHFGTEVDIGSMMTASVALGVAVDDTIHFLSWFRAGMREGLDRLSAIRAAYAKVATAMTQTTLIAGLGLSAFAFSTFTPTQRFGILMLTLLFTALIGDLILLPALLASRIGKLLEVRPWNPPISDADGASAASVDVANNSAPEMAVDSGSAAQARGALDGPHNRKRDHKERQDR